MCGVYGVSVCVYMVYVSVVSVCVWCGNCMYVLWVFVCDVVWYECVCGR